MSQVYTDESEYDEWVVDDVDYVQEAQQIVYNNSRMTIENALILNTRMRSYLHDLKDELERLLNVCQQKYKTNELMLDAVNKAKSAPKLYATYYFCGYPFFKDQKGGAPPQSSEYLKRIETGNELFPLNLLEKLHIWISRDKFELVQGVKQQVISYLQSVNRSKMRQTATKRCASDLMARISNENDSLKTMHLKDLMKMTDGTGFRINWRKISLEALEDRHTPNECMAMWYAYLMPTLNRKPWTSDEEDKLLNASIQFGGQNWPKIAEAVENRSVYQCFVHYRTVFDDKGNGKNVRWTPYEDQMLLDYVEKYRIGNIIPWTKVMEHFVGRSKMQVYNRYMFSLNPEINRSPFTIEEDCILMAAIKEYGTNYQNFPTNLLPGRNMKQIRNRYNNVLKLVKTREHWTELHDFKLMELVEKYGTMNWVKVSEEMVNHSRTSCRQRYTTIKKFLEKHPNTTVADVPRRKKAFSTNVTTENWMETIIQAKNSEFESINMFSEEEDEDDNNKPKKTTIMTQDSIYNTPYYDYFKYSFNFKFGDAIEGSHALFENVQTACQLLQAPNIPQAINIYDRSFSSYVTLSSCIEKVQLEPALLRSLLETGKNDFLYPVNLNTILGWRGLVTMFETTKRKDNSGQNIKCEPNTTDGQEALELFKMRFKSIFKQTAQVAKLKRTFTSVSVRLGAEKKRKRSITSGKVATTTTTATATSTSTTDFHNNQTLVRIIDGRHDEATQEMECDKFDYVSDVDEEPSKRMRITVLESTTLGFNNAELDPLELSQASNSNELSQSNVYRYRVLTSDSIEFTNIQPCTSESETEGPGTEYSSTDFVIWTPTVTDDATGSSQTKKT